MKIYDIMLLVEMKRQKNKKLVLCKLDFDTLRIEESTLIQSCS